MYNKIDLVLCDLVIVTCYHALYVFCVFCVLCVQRAAYACVAHCYVVSVAYVCRVLRAACCVLRAACCVLRGVCVVLIYLHSPSAAPPSTQDTSNVSSNFQTLCLM